MTKLEIIKMLRPELLAELRREAGLSLGATAELFYDNSTSKSLWAHWEKGRQRPNPVYVSFFCDKTGFDWSALIHDGVVARRGES